MQRLTIRSSKENFAFKLHPCFLIFFICLGEWPHVFSCLSQSSHFAKRKSRPAVGYTYRCKWHCPNTGDPRCNVSMGRYILQRDIGQSIFVLRRRLMWSWVSSRTVDPRPTMVIVAAMLRQSSIPRQWRRRLFVESVVSQHSHYYYYSSHSIANYYVRR